jgi:hypothetical protein
MVCLWSHSSCGVQLYEGHQCAHNMMNNLSCFWICFINVMDHIAKWHLGWIIHEIFYIPISPPYHIVSLPTKYALNLKVVWCCLVIQWREFGIHGLSWIKNNYGAAHQHTFLLLMIFWSLANTYKHRVTFCMRLVSPQSHKPMYTTFDLFVGKCNMMLFFDKSLCKIP